MSNVTNIPLFQFPPSIESELAARGYTSSTHGAAPMQQAHYHQHYDNSGAFVTARRPSTSTIPHTSHSQQTSHRLSGAPERPISSSLSTTTADMQHFGNALTRHFTDPHVRHPHPSSPLRASFPDRAAPSTSNTTSMHVDAPSPLAHFLPESSRSSFRRTTSRYTATPPPQYVHVPSEYVSQDACPTVNPHPYGQNQSDVAHASPPTVMSGGVMLHDRVKQEEFLDNMPMSFARDVICMSPEDAVPLYTLQVDEQLSMETDQTFAFKQEPPESTIQHQESWYGASDYNASQQQLCIDTSVTTSPHDYVFPYSATYEYMDSPMSLHNHDLHQLDSHQSRSPAPSLHTIVLPPFSKNRSYTLEGAITPVSPPPAPPPQPQPQNTTVASSHVPSSSSSAVRRDSSQSLHRVTSPPPMGCLRPPALTSSHSPVKTECPASVVPSAPETSSSAYVPSPLLKRPRGRPRKNPPPERPSSPAPPVNYPFPQFPDPSSSPDKCDGSEKGTAPEFASLGGVVPPIAGPVPTITAGTAGAFGRMPGSSSSSKTQAHSHPDVTAAAAGEEKANASANVPAGLTAGQGIFRLNMPREGEDGAAEATGEKKKPIMACLFCRERKIACGPPPPGGPRRCNQCTRRDLVCEYPKESRRGQHKRGPRAVRVEALAVGASTSTLKPKPNKRKPSSTVRIDTVRALQPAYVPVQATDDAGNAQPFPSSPLSPLTPLSSSPLASGSVHSAGPFVERPSRSEKVVLAHAGKGTTLEVAVAGASRRRVGRFAERGRAAGRSDAPEEARRRVRGRCSRWVRMR
ncbi:hypothetical protein BN946_scf184969.g70 [Trametes cinnabarina]|uniref:Zn(2)-C6 fungal-type domain-containing protein n=1 Tax=Pycnoporus cinnabarinus TaxID=5643 RepID=A0A060SZN5_PYCCI|nr:hypothetical protein BN946_scf184969.g70 [Trametes cinnabarina]